ncbi:MAG: multiple sugar transport system permease protein [Chloroflexota bacterium]|jgi:multiple sugar transport system permease protein|nr:multiple sugar transport system permease protein [Chloroflexota bacterium]
MPDVARLIGPQDRRARSHPAVLLLAPAVAVLLLMTVAPAIYLLWSSLFRFNLLASEAGVFVGLGNYVDILGSTDFVRHFGITLLFVVTSVSLELAIGLVVAVLLARKGPDLRIAAGLLILPMAITPVVAALVWRALLNPNYGWIDYYLQTLGLIEEPVAWLSAPVTAWIALLALDAWQWMPFVALILLAGLQGLPTEPLEAAAVDGAGRLSMFRFITLPMMRPFIVIAVLLRTVDAFKTFGTVQVLTNGGPGDATEIVNLSIYRVALQNFQVGTAAAMGILFLVVVTIVIQQLLRVMARNTDVLED